MTFTLLTRRSNVAGNVPTVAQLNNGEISINTNDGLLYFLQSNTIGNGIISLGPIPNTANAFTNPVTIALSNAITGSTIFSGANNVNIPTTLSTVGTQGTYSAVSVNTYGQVIAGFNQTATGDLTGTANNTNLSLTLAASGVSAGTYNYGTLVVNAKGLITSIGNFTNVINYVGDLTGNAVYGSNVVLRLSNTTNTSPGTYIWGAIANNKGLVTGPLPGTFASSFNISAGYQVLPSGFVFQWGLGGLMGGISASQTVTFPIAFPNKVLNIQLADADGPFSASSGFFYSAPLSNSATSFTFYYNCTSTATSPTFYFWQAIGH